MAKVEPFLWKCKCGAVHDERVDLNEIYDQGWAAGYADLMPECPYPEVSPEADSWNAGYAQGSRDC